MNCLLRIEAQNIRVIRFKALSKLKFNYLTTNASTVFSTQPWEGHITQVQASSWLVIILPESLISSLMPSVSLCYCTERKIYLNLFRTEKHFISFTA